MYTLGRIGRFKVVSTKLSRKSTSEQEARICDENTITRLLGKIYYNFIIYICITKVLIYRIISVSRNVPEYKNLTFALLLFVQGLSAK